MFNGLSQIAIITAMNLRNLPQRIGTSSVAVFGVACVVGVLIGVMSMASGFQRTMTNAGSPTTAIVMRTGATSELNSGIIGGFFPAIRAAKLPVATALRET